MTRRKLIKLSCNNPTPTNGGGSVNQDTTIKVTGPVIKAGSILLLLKYSFAVLDIGINSDEKSPILATYCHRKIKRHQVNWEFCPSG